MGVAVVQTALSRNCFLEIKKWLHVADNSSLDTSDKLAKVRPLLTLVKKNFSQFGVFSEYLSIDETMIPYFAKFGIKMFIRGKPIRFAFVTLKATCTTLISRLGSLLSSQVHLVYQ